MNGRPQFMKRGRNQRRRQGPNLNRALDSNGPDVRIRGTANQIYDKYLALARDANSSGDRVKAENYLQHAEHYFRIIKAMQPQQTSHGEFSDADGDQPMIADNDRENDRFSDSRLQNGDNGGDQGGGHNEQQDDDESADEQPTPGAPAVNGSGEQHGQSQSPQGQQGDSDREGRRRRRRPRRNPREGGTEGQAAQGEDAESTDVAAE